MKPIHPSELMGKHFSTVENGYAPDEVDAYIRLIAEQYELLYRSQTENEIVEEAYLKADAIIAAAQTSCDAVLRNFREKAELQQKLLEDMRGQVFAFQNELFEKYRLHIELIERMLPGQNEDEWLSPDDCMERIAEELRRDMAAQYDLTLSSPVPEKKEESRPAKAAPSEPRCRQVKKTVRADKKPVPVQPQLSVMELLNEYEDQHAFRKARNASEEQFALNFEDGSLHTDQ